MLKPLKQTNRGGRRIFQPGGAQPMGGTFANKLRGTLARDFWLAALGALYQLGHLPTTGGARAPCAPLVGPPLTNVLKFNHL